MTIDMHCHYVPEPMAALLRRRTEAPRIARHDDGGEHFFMPVNSLAFGDDYTDMDKRLAFMDAHGVTMQVLSFPGLFGVDSLTVDEAMPLVTAFNDHLGALCRAHPDRFAGLAVLPMADMAAAVAELRRAREVNGMIGAILPVNAFLSLVEAEKLAPLFAAGNELGVHFFIHPSRRPDQVPPPGTAPRPPFSDTIGIRHGTLNVQALLSQVMATFLFTDFLEPYANVSVHVANLGGTLPFVLERMDHTAMRRGSGGPPPSSRVRRVHVDCASLGPRALELAVKVYGANKVVFGTDCPIYSTEYSQAAIAEAAIDDAAREAIRSGNAEKLVARARPSG